MFLRIMSHVRSLFSSIGKRQCTIHDFTALFGTLLVMSVRCRILDTVIDGSTPGYISLMCPRAKHFIRITSFDSAVANDYLDRNTIVKGVCSIL